MCLVCGMPIFPMFHKVHVMLFYNGGSRSHQLGKRTIMKFCVCISEITSSWYQKCNFSRGCSFFRSYEKRNIVFICSSFHMCRINATLKVIRDVKFKIHLPLGISKVIIVKMNRTILIRGMNKIMLITCPIVTCHCSGW
ncbi:hypothetical protein D1872_206650 [compost metagenome]